MKKSLDSISRQKQATEENEYLDTQERRASIRQVPVSNFAIRKVNVQKVKIQEKIL